MPPDMRGWRGAGVAAGAAGGGWVDGGGGGGCAVRCHSDPGPTGVPAAGRL